MQAVVTTTQQSGERAVEMIRGLRITMSGHELSDRIAQRVRAHEEAIRALDVRIKQREGDQPFDVRAEDGFKSLGELAGERQHYRDRVDWAHQLVAEGRARWNGGKPTGAGRPTTIKGRTASAIVLEDRR